MVKILLTLLGFPFFVVGTIAGFIGFHFMAGYYYTDTKLEKALLRNKTDQ